MMASQWQVDMIIMHTALLQSCYSLTLQKPKLQVDTSTTHTALLQPCHLTQPSGTQNAVMQVDMIMTLMTHCPFAVIPFHQPSGTQIALMQ